VLRAEGRADGSITLDFPVSPLTPQPVTEQLARALGAAPVGAHGTGPALGDLLVELDGEAAVRALEPDLRALGALAHRGVIATAAADPGRGYDYVSRFFGPAVGIDEDPVTGSAHTALAPLWSARFGREALTGFQASRRGGTVHTELRGERVLLTGRAVTVLEGELAAGV
jgi:predicted PhzF superfamily epimerase YddE/YHI9